MNSTTKQLTDYLDKMGVEYTIDTNPTPEKIVSIKRSIKRRDDLTTHLFG